MIDTKPRFPSITTSSIMANSAIPATADADTAALPVWPFFITAEDIKPHVADADMITHLLNLSKSHPLYRALVPFAFEKQCDIFLKHAQEDTNLCKNIDHYCDLCIK